ncbi:ketosamine-3-kinase-like [Haliotis cracherodii]|uniref:ketosamine-3-kinase-like n=1 Tax=Haliotis cracherodii TaxID=6455 RepID=UPI0039E9ABDF
MEDMLKKELATSVLKNTGRGGGGCVNQGVAYETDQGLVFVKMNSNSGARKMFDGEFASLVALHTADEVRVPKPIKVLTNPEGGALLVMEYLDMRSLSSHSAALGQQLARLHQQNAGIGQRMLKEQQSVHKNSDLNYVDKFGFDVETCCGYLPQSNAWTDSWVQFYAQKIEEQIQMLESEYRDKGARELWSQILPSLSKLFDGLDIQPALLHGDLWGGNVGQLSDRPVIFDPCSFYGHAEFDLGICNMFGGFNSAFFKNYFKVLPKQPGYETRLQLYLLFHNLNHWNHFGSTYRGSSMGILKHLVKELKKS